MESPLTISTIIVIVSLIVPGIIFKRFFFLGQFSKQFGAGLFADRLITNLFLGILVQIATYLSFSYALNVNYVSIQTRVKKTFYDINANNLPDVTNLDLGYIFGYMFTSMVIAALSGFILYQIIRIFKIDVHTEAFRFANEWHYYFTGEIMSNKAFRSGRRGKILSTEVDVLVNDGGEKAKMFSGVLAQYTLSSKTGDLERIYLTQALRYSHTPPVGFKVIPGDCLVIPYDKILDLNLRYNREEDNSNLRRTTFYKLFDLLTLIYLLAVIIWPWFRDISFANRIGGVVAFLLSWSFFLTLFYRPRQDSNSNLRRSTWWVIFVMFIASVIFGISFLDLWKFILHPLLYLKNQIF